MSTQKPKEMRARLSDGGSQTACEVRAAAQRYGVPLDDEQIAYIAGCVDALRESAARIREHERNDEPAFGFRHPPGPSVGQ
jgi:hypothetical protein